jgi:hypothetical protein
MGEFDLRRYEVVRTQFFASASKTSVSFSKNGIRFSRACIRKFTNTEYIEIQVHPHKQLIAVLPCSEQHKTKMCWARIYDDGISVRKISGGAFLNILFELFGWDIELRYRLRGGILRFGEKTVALFDAQTPEIFESRYDMVMPWMDGFGEDYYNYRNSQLPNTFMMDFFLEYTNEPNLQPTTQEAADDHIRSLIEKMQAYGRDLYISSDILS